MLLGSDRWRAWGPRSNETVTLHTRLKNSPQYKEEIRPFDQLRLESRICFLLKKCVVLYFEDTRS